MKTFIFVIAILCIYYTKTANSKLVEMSEFQKNHLERVEPCRHLLTNETQESLRVNGTADTQDYKCYITCFIKRKNYLQDGKIFIDKYKKFIEEDFQERKERLIRTAEACIDEAESGETECDVGFRFQRCFRREQIKYYRQRHTHHLDEHRNQRL